MAGATISFTMTLTDIPTNLGNMTVMNGITPVANILNSTIEFISDQNGDAIVDASDLVIFVANFNTQLLSGWSSNFTGSTVTSGVGGTLNIVCTITTSAAIGSSYNGYSLAVTGVSTPVTVGGTNIFSGGTFGAMTSTPSTTYTLVGTNVQVTTAPTTNYNSLVANLPANPAWVQRFDTQADSVNQVNQPISITKKDEFTGNSLGWTIIPRTPPNQQLPVLNDIKSIYPIVIDGFTTWNTTIIANDRILYYFWFVKLDSFTIAEQHILKENIQAVWDAIRQQNEQRAEKWEKNLDFNIYDDNLYPTNDGNTTNNIAA